MENKTIKVGKFVNTFGIKGEIKVLPNVEYFTKLKKIYIGSNEFEISKMRAQKNVYIVKLKNVDDINLIEKYKGMDLTIDESDKPKPKDGEYYKEDLIGMEVITDDGKNLGKLDDIFNTGANDIYQVGEILLPAIDDVIKQIVTKNNRIIVHILKGLI